MKVHRIEEYHENTQGPLAPTPRLFAWHDPTLIPPRPWLYGSHLLRKQVSVTVAPGGVGKSSLVIVEALSMASGRDLLGEGRVRQLRVWIINLEDPREELERRIIAAMIHHGIRPEEIEGQLYLSGREEELCIARMGRDGIDINDSAIGQLEARLRAEKIDVVSVDPFISSHQVPENDNGAIDKVAKTWAALADRCDCAVELIHHTRKLNGEDGTSEAARGATALLAAARSGRVLNRMSDKERQDAGVVDDPATYFSVTRDKPNLAPAGKRVWRRMTSVDLGNNDPGGVGVAERWIWPDTFEGFSASDLLAVQRALHGRKARRSDQAADWAGKIVAQELRLDAARDGRRIKKLIAGWLASGALISVELSVPGDRHKRPCLEVGEWASE